MVHLGAYTARANELLKAEILWTLYSVTAHHSYRSNAIVGKLFASMFPDSDIASKFSCGEKKSAYLCVFGLGQHFKDLLLADVKGPYTVMFDETLNKTSQKKQMDLHIRFWKGTEVVTRYFGSQFLGHATAEDMLTHFSEGILEGCLKVKDMLQVSMDGPNVNWKFLELLKTKLQNDFNSSVLNVGSCGLHVVHNSFKAGSAATGWNISMYQ
ncbi:Uncharacterised protein g1835 [Pycnogonum litorale]